MKTSEEKVEDVIKALKNLNSNNAEATIATLEETKNFQSITDLKKGDKLRYKGGCSLTFPKIGDEIFVYSTDLPEAEVRCSSKKITREDFTFLVNFDGDICEFSADSRYFERA
jgi:hypothetical protein